MGADAVMTGWAGAGAATGWAGAAASTEARVALIVPCADCGTGVASAEEFSVSEAGSAAAGAGTSAGPEAAFSATATVASDFGAAVAAESVVGAADEDASNDTVTVLPSPVML